MKLGIDARVVAVAGRPVRSYIFDKSYNHCHCPLCDIGVNCNRRNVVYKATCRTCQEFYLGGTARPTHYRVGEHEASVRYKNDNSALGQHHKLHAPKTPEELHRRKYQRVGKPSIENFLKTFDFEIVDFGRDPLDTFIREGILIQELNPKINNCQNNGFVR